MRNFDIVSIDPIIDWFNIMTYDLHGTWDSTDKEIGSIVLAHTNLTGGFPLYPGLINS